LDELEVVVVEVVDEFENDVLPVLFVAGGDDLVFDGLISVLLFSAFMPMKRSPAKPPPQTSTTTPRIKSTQTHVFEDLTGGCIEYCCGVFQPGCDPG